PSFLFPPPPKGGGGWGRGSCSSPSRSSPNTKAQDRRHILAPAADKAPETGRGLALAGGARLADVADLHDTAALAAGARQEIKAVLAVVAAQADLVQHRAARGDETGRVVAHGAAEQEPRAAVDDGAERDGHAVAACVAAAGRIARADGHVGAALDLLQQ